jgi:alanine racemase
MDLDNFTTWLEIDLGAISNNYQILSKVTGTPVMPVIKANAYGHGLEEVAKTIEKAGALWCGVARIEEALMLRNAGINLNILVLGYTPPQRIQDAIDNRISITVYDFELAEKYVQIAQSKNGRIRVHIKVDTGMGRLGILHEEALQLIKYIKDKPEFEVQGLFTHFACADEPEKFYTIEQLEKFKKIIDAAEKQGLRPPLVHAANSAATLNFPESRFDIVRCGLAIFGLSPSRSTTLPVDIKPALAWKTRLISIKNLPTRHGVSYGFKYFTSKEENIGVIAAGYADGLRRRMGNYVLLRGKRVPVVGNICMDLCMLQLDDVPDAQIGDEVVLIGQQGDQAITATDIARDWGTISYEVICGMAARMPREYIR